MSKTRTKYSTVKVTTKSGKLIGYLSLRDEEKGLDIKLANQGYILTTL